MALQNNGLVVMSGDFLNNTYQYSAMVVRYTTSGELDTSFGEKGVVVIPRWTDATALSIQNDLKIVVVGYYLKRDWNYKVYLNMQIARLTYTGELDSSFGYGGIVTIPVVGDYYGGMPRSVVLDAEQRILVGGVLQDFVNQSFVVRYSTSGILDSSFGNGTGVFVSGVGPSNFYLGTIRLAMSPDGQFATFRVVGYLTEAAVARYDGSSGAADLSFGSGGQTTFSLYRVGGIAIQKDSKIVICGVSVGKNLSFRIGNFSHISLRRFNVDGTLDNSFGVNGLAQVSLLTNNTYGGFAQKIVIQGDGRILLFGSVFTSPSTSDFLLVRLLGNGTPDVSFGNDGIATATANSSVCESQTLVGGVIDANGIIVAGGHCYVRDRDVSNRALLRFNATGALECRASILRVSLGLLVLIAFLCLP
jgi:uncharacterized delta-60 repeat protein